MGSWIVENINGINRPFSQSFRSAEETQTWIDRMGPVIAREWKPVYVPNIGECPNIARILNEGLGKRDLEDILLPRLSVDEYVPSDPNTDNIVLALFIKGVPEAVLPFKNFCERCNGVLEVDYGDSDTVVDTSVIYIEYDREKLDVDDIRDLMAQVSMLANIEENDFTLTFPHTTRKFPYSIESLQQYFISRTMRDNRLAQMKAEREAQQKAEKQISQMKSNREQEETKESSLTDENLADKLVDILFE